MEKPKATILIVDDDPVIRNMLTDRLETQGHTTIQAGDGEQGLKIAGSTPLDLILLDIMMPVMTGHEMLTRLKADDQLKHIPVIVISARDDMESIIKCIELGADDYMVKPFRSLILRARINACLEKKWLRDQEQGYITEVEAANTAKSEFVSIVSHELKTPMTAIKGYTDLLLAGSLGPITDAQRSFLETIRANTNRMATLVSDLADISRVESGRLFLEMDKVNMAEVMEAVLHSTQRQIEAKNQRIHIDDLSALPPVWADFNRVVQIFTNLVSNANKYSPDESQISISAEKSADFPNAIHVTVTDNGIGIKPDDLTQVFKQFFRSQDEAVREEQGHGLGLSITQDLVEAMGGKIWVESEYGQGSTFHITLPVAT